MFFCPWGHHSDAMNWVHVLQPNESYSSRSTIILLALDRITQFFFSRSVFLSLHPAAATAAPDRRYRGHSVPPISSYYSLLTQRAPCFNKSIRSAPRLPHPRTDTAPLTTAPQPPHQPPTQLHLLRLAQNCTLLTQPTGLRGHNTP